MESFPTGSECAEPDGGSRPRPEPPREDGGPLRRHARVVPRRARPDDRGPGSADHRDRPRRQRSLRLVDHDLPADQHHQRPVLGQAVGPVRPQADLHDRHRHLPGRLRPVRAQPEHGDADPLPRYPGHRRRFVVPGGARHHRRHVHAGRTRQVPGAVRGGVRHRLRRRPARRRLPDRAGQLALDLLRQHPDRNRRVVRDPTSAAECEAGAGDPQLRHPRRRHIHGCRQPGARGPHQRAVRRVDRPDRRRIHHRGPDRDRAIHPGRGARQGADRPARVVPKSDLFELDGLDVLRELRVLRRDHLPAALVPVRP